MLPRFWAYAEDWLNRQPLQNLSRFAQRALNLAHRASVPKSRRYRHARACRGHPGHKAPAWSKDVDGRDKPGHDKGKLLGESNHNRRG
jgi:hypothetical protein